MMGWSSRCYIPSFVKIGPPVLKKKILKGFYHIWAWWPSWSCDPYAANKKSFPLPKEAPHKIWLRSAQRFRRRRSLSNVNSDANGRRRTEGRRLDGYTISSPCEPHGSGELKTIQNLLLQNRWTYFHDTWFVASVKPEKDMTLWCRPVAHGSQYV